MTSYAGLGYFRQGLAGLGLVMPGYFGLIQIT